MPLNSEGRQRNTIVAFANALLKRYDDERFKIENFDVTQYAIKLKISQAHI